MPRPRDGAPTPPGAPATPGDSKVVDLLSSPVRAASRTRRFATGEVIVHEGEPGSSAFILLSGRCDVTVHGDILNVVGPGEFFGEIACLEGGTRTATVRAAAECDVTRARRRGAESRARPIARVAREVPSRHRPPRSRYLPPRDDGEGRATRVAASARKPASITRPVQKPRVAVGRSSLAAAQLCVGRLLRRAGTRTDPLPVRAGRRHGARRPDRSNRRLDPRPAS